MSQFHVGDKVRVKPERDERRVALTDPKQALVALLIGGPQSLRVMRESLTQHPDATGTVVAVDATYHNSALGRTLHEAVLVDIDYDAHMKSVPYKEFELELVQSFDNELTAFLAAEAEKPSE